MERVFRVEEELSLVFAAQISKTDRRVLYAIRATSQARFKKWCHVDALREKWGLSPVAYRKKITVGMKIVFQAAEAFATVLLQLTRFPEKMI